MICVLLALCVMLGAAGCGGFKYGVNEVQVLVEQDYSLAFRNDDPLYFYVTAALSVLAAQGKVDELAIKWLGSAALDFPKQAGEFWGLDVELAIAVCDLLGWNLKMQQIEKENVYIELSSGNIDVAWGGIALDQKDIDAGKFTQYGPYIHNDIVIATRNGSSVWNKLRLNGRKMCMPSTPEALDALNTDEKLVNRLGQITRLAGGTTECFEYLYAGKCDVVLTDSTALSYFNCH